MENLISFQVLYFSVVLLIFQLSVYILPSRVINTFVCISCVFTGTVLSYYLYPWFKRRCLSKKVLTHDKAVLITGCDSGFRHELAKRLHSAGYLVFAGCLFIEDEGAKTLKKLNRLHVLELDVTNDQNIANAVNYVKENLGKSELWAIMNNAGIFEGTAVELTKMKNFESCLNVNTLGAVRVTKAFLSLLRKSGGRIVTTSSLIGRFATQNAAAYCMSKFAVIAFSDSLRSELKPWGIKIITIEPDGFQTKTSSFDNIQRTIKENIADMEDDTMSAYGEDYIVAMETNTKKMLQSLSDKIYKVVDAMEDAISLVEPSNVYRPCRNMFTSFLATMFVASPRSVQELIFSSYNYFSGLPHPAGAKNN